MVCKDGCEGAMKNQEIALAAAELLRGAGILITPEEQQRMEVADFGLGELAKTGLQILTYVNTERVCAKELVMIPGQTCPEHWHPTIGGVLGKEETFRCRWGNVSLYVPGERTVASRCLPPVGSEDFYTVGHEIHLEPGGAVHDLSGYAALASGGAAGSDCVGIFDAEHG
jgi:D-lyxose ketol-isomerase